MENSKRKSGRVSNTCKRTEDSQPARNKNLKDIQDLVPCAAIILANILMFLLAKLKD